MSEHKHAYIYMRRDEDYISMHESFINMVTYENIKDKSLVMVLAICDGCSYFQYGDGNIIVTKVTHERIADSDGNAFNIVDYINECDLWGELDHDEELWKALRGIDSEVVFL